MTPAHFIRILEVPEEERAKYDLSSLRLIVHGAAPCPVDGEADGSSRRCRADRGLGAVRRQRGRRHAHRSATSGWSGRAPSACRGPASRCASSAKTERVPPGDDGRHLHHAAGRREVPLPRRAGEDRAGVARRRVHRRRHRLPRRRRLPVHHRPRVGHGHPRRRERVPREIEEVLLRAPRRRRLRGVRRPRRALRRGSSRRWSRCATRSTPDDLQAFVRERLADYKCPTVVEFVDELPRDPNGKVMKRWLRDQAWAGHDSHIG